MANGILLHYAMMLPSVGIGWIRTATLDLVCREGALTPADMELLGHTVSSSIAITREEVARARINKDDLSGTPQAPYHRRALKVFAESVSLLEGLAVSS
jgi:hypothetical protein